MDINKSRNIENVHELVAIEFPGKVENVHKVADTFGGIEELSKNFAEGEKLQLRFGNTFTAKPLISSDVSLQLNNFK